MQVFTWSPAHSVRVRQIDEQHKRLMQSVNSLCEAIVVAADRDLLDRAFDDLLVNVRMHFLAEHPRHRAQEQRLIEAIDQFRRQSDAGESHAHRQFIQFLRDWLHAHIRHAHAALDVAFSDAENDAFPMTASAA